MIWREIRFSLDRHRNNESLENNSNEKKDQLTINAIGVNEHTGLKL